MAELEDAPWATESAAPGGLPDLPDAPWEASPSHESSAPDWIKSVSRGADSLPAALKMNPLTGPIVAPLAALPETYEFGKQALKGLYEIPGKVGAAFSSPESKTPAQLPGADAFQDQKESFKRKAIELGASPEDADHRAQTLVQRMQRGEALQSVLFGLPSVLFAPAMGMYRHYVSDPLEQAGGPPRDVTEGATMAAAAAAGLRPGMNALRQATGRPLEGEVMPPSGSHPGGPAGGAGAPGRGGPTIEGEYTSPTQERPGSGVRILPKDYAGTGREGDPYHDAAWAALGERGGAGATGVPGGPLANMHPKAIELAKKIFSEEGLSPWERDRRLEEMSPHQFGAEWSDSSRMAVSGLHRKGGEPATIIGPAFRGRKSETPERISGHFDEMFGPYKNLTEDQARINKERDAASRPFWNIFNKTRVEPTPRLEALRDALDASGAWAGAEKLLRIGRVPREQHLMIGGEDVMAPTAQFYQAAKMSIDAKIAKALKDEDGPLAMHLVGLKHELIGAINEHHNPDVAGKWKMALDTWAGPEAMKAAQDLGEKILTQHVKARDINTIVNSYGAPERAEIGTGIREYLEDRLGNPGNVDLGVINTVLGRNNIKKLKAIYGDEQVDKFVNTMLHEHDMHFSHDRIIRNSVTAEATNAAKRFDPAEKWYNSVGPGDVPRSLSQVAMKGFSKGVERLQKQQVEKAQQEQNKINADVARIMTLQGPERNAVIRYLTGGDAPAAPAGSGSPGPGPTTPGGLATPSSSPPEPEVPVSRVRSSVNPVPPQPHANAMDATATLKQFGYPQEDINRMVAGTRMKTADMLRQSYPDGPPPKPVASFPFDREMQAGRSPEVLAPTPAPGNAAKQLSLLEWIRKQGGISPDDPMIGDVRGMFGGKNPGAIVRKGGKTLDQLREGAVGEKYFLDQGDIEGREASTDINTLLDAMEREGRGEKQYRVGETSPEEIPGARGEQELDQRQNFEVGPEAKRFDQELSRFDVTPDMIPTGIRHRALEIMMTEGERDPVAAYERAVMEETDAFERGGQDFEGDPFDANPTPENGRAPAQQGERASGRTARALGEDQGGQDGYAPLGGPKKRASGGRANRKNEESYADWRERIGWASGGRVNRANGGRVDPNNIHISPSEAQKEAGNYAKDHVHIHGLDLTIENAKGSKRSGVDKGGKPWSVTLPHHYGYIKGSVGADQDHVDCYLGPHKNAPNVWVVDQQDADTKKFDEVKCLIGFASAQQARNCYLKAFSDGRGKARIRAMHKMTIGDFKDWLAKGDTTKAMAAA